MANFFQRQLSKLDFWDKEENAKQQQQFREEDEERKRRERAAAQARANANPAPGSVVRPTQPAQPDETFKGLESTGQKNKTIFGWNAAALLPKSLEKVDQVRAGRDVTTNRDKYVADYDKLDEERRRILVNDANERAAKGDMGAQNTVRVLRESGRLKGGASDFAAGANDKLYGGINRAAARTIELLPGNQGTGEWADKEARNNRQVTTTGKAGEKFGSAEKAVFDVATIAAPTSKLDKAVEASRAYQALRSTGKVGTAGAAVAKTTIGSLAGTGIDAVQQNGRGDDVDLAKSAATGVGVDVGLSALPYGFGKLAKMIRGKGGQDLAEETARETLALTGDAKAIAGKTALNEAENVAAGRSEDAADIPGRHEGSTVAPDTPRVEVAPGIKSTNQAKTPEPTMVQNEQGAMIDRGTDLKIGELIDSTDGVPVAPGMKRLYQGTENGMPTDWNFDNVDDLAQYFSNRGDNVDFSYRDVPEADALPQVARGKGVYRVNTPQADGPASVEQLTSEYAEMLEQMDAGLSGGQIQSDFDGGYVRTTEHSPFYRDFFAMNGRKPSKADYQAEALRQLQSGKADPMAQEEYAGLVSRPNIPAPDAPMALARVDDTPASVLTDQDLPYSDFRNSIQVPLEKATPEEIAPAPVAPPQVAASTPDISEAPAPRTRERASSRITDDDLRNEVLENFPERETLNIAETEQRVVQDINNMTDEQLVGSLPSNVIVDTPEDFLRTVNSIRRLETINTPESQEAIANAVNALSDFSARSGRNLRTTQILFDDMPVALKVRSLEKQLGKAGAELDDVQMARLTDLVTLADDASDNLRSLQDEARALLEDGSINNASLSDEVEERARVLVDAISEAQTQKELRAGEAWRYWQEQMPPTTLGKRIGDVGRTLMLSSPTGRVFDVGSTAMTTADDLLTSGVSNLIGKGINLAKQSGTVSDVIADPRSLVKGVREGLSRAKNAFQGKDYVEDVLGEAKRSTRGDVNTGGGRVRQLIRAGVELPTNLSRGLRNQELYRQGAQEAAQQGLTGTARDVYANLRASIPTEEQLNKAVQTHMRANMLHDNGISRALNNVANSLDKKGGGWAAPFIRNQIAPFTSFLGGNLHRTLTDKNVLFNVGSAINNATKGNMQGVVDDIAKFAVNSGEAYAAGMLLTQAGIITTEDANGDSYGGLYFHIGDRYIPVAAAGTVAVPIILGNGIEQARQAGENGGSTQEVVEAFVNSAGLNTLKNAGVASVFGGENNLQSSFDAALREGGNLVNGGAEFTGNIVRQYIPSLLSDVNAGLDMTKMNPTGEAAETRVTRENPETGREVNDVIGTEVNKTLNKIPVASQYLERKPDTNARDLLDRVTKGNQETDKQTQQAESVQSLKEMKAQLVRDNVPFQSEDIKTALNDGDYDKAKRGLEYQIAEERAKPSPSKSVVAKLEDQIKQADLGSRGVPTSDDGVKARVEDGDYGSAIEGLQYQVDKSKGDKNVPQSKLQKMKDDITRLKVAQTGEYSPKTIELYNKISKSEWKAMGDADSEDYDPDTFAMLAQYDAELAANKVSGSDKDGSKPKYYTSGSGSGGSGSRKVLTDIARQSPSTGFTPIKLQKAEVGSRTSPIQKLEKVRNNDTSKLKKISVSRGGRA